MLLDCAAFLFNFLTKFDISYQSVFFHNSHNRFFFFKGQSKMHCKWQVSNCVTQAFTLRLPSRGKCRSTERAQGGLFALFCFFPILSLDWGEVLRNGFALRTGTVPVSDLKLWWFAQAITRAQRSVATAQTDRQRQTQTQTAAAERPTDGRSLLEPPIGPPLIFILSVTAANFVSSLGEVTFQSPHGILSKRQSGGGTTCTAHQAAQVGRAVEKI